MKFVTNILLSCTIMLVVMVSMTVPAEARTSTTYKITKSQPTLTIYPYLTGDKKVLFVDFESKELKTIEKINFNVTYDSDNGFRGTEGTIMPAAQMKLNDYKVYNGIPYVRRNILLGTCSKNVCVYDNSPRNITITATVLWSNGQETQQVITVY